MHNSIFRTWYDIADICKIAICKILKRGIPRIEMTALFRKISNGI